MYCKPEFRNIYICEDFIMLVGTAIRWVLGGLIEDLACRVKPKDCPDLKHFYLWG